MTEPRKWTLSQAFDLMKTFCNEAIHVDDDFKREVENAAEEVSRLIPSATAAPEMLRALRECLTDEGARAFTDESRNSASYARRRLDVINEIIEAAIAKAEGRGDANA